VFLLEDFF